MLCDFDSCALGPPEWDLIPVAVGDVGFPRPAAHLRDFTVTYGFDVRDWEGFEVLHGIRDLKLIAGVSPEPDLHQSCGRNLGVVWPACARRFERWQTIRR